MAPGRSFIGKKPLPKRSPVPMYAGIGVAVLGLLAVVGYVALSFLGGPKLTSLSPGRVRVGAVLTLTGSGFAPDASRNEVFFDEKGTPARAVNPTSLEVVVPDPGLGAASQASVQVRIRVGERETAPLALEIYLGPTLHGISPDVAMQGDEITLAGVGFGLSPAVTFGGKEAEILEARDTTLRVRVPALAGGPGTAAPVIVLSSGTPSNEGPFFIGRLPLVLAPDPAPVNLGDLVTLKGKGFRRERVQNQVTVNGVRALVVSSADSEIRFAVPRVSAPNGSAVVEVVVPGGQEPGRVTLSLFPQGALVEARFIPEPFDAAPGRDHAVIATGLGPAFVVASSQGRSAAERAAEFAKRLTAAAAALQERPAENLEIRGLDGTPAIAMPGSSEAVLEITPEDVAAYDEDWTGLRGRGGPVTAARLGRWWEAVARDLVLLLVRHQAPRFAAALAPEGRVLGDMFQAATRARQSGIPVSQISSAKPAQLAALRLVGLRVPAAVTGPRVAAALGAPVTPPSSGATPLKLAGMWVGSEVEDGMKRYITLDIRGRGGDLIFEGAVSVKVPLQSLEEPQKGTVRFLVVFRGGERHYVGKWDGEAITGKVTSDVAGARLLGSFELRPR